MRLLHTTTKIHIGFDDENLLGAAGLVPLMALAARIGLPGLVDAHLHLPAEAGDAGANAAAKVSTLLAGMAAGADCIDDMNLLRNGAYDAVFGGARASSTLGTFLRALGIGNISQLAKILRLALCRSVEAAPGVLAGLDSLAILDLDSCQRRVYGPAKQGARFGHTKIASKSVAVRGLNALIGTISAPTSPPLVANARLRAGNAVSSKGADRFAAETISTARAAGATGILFARMDAGFYAGKVVSACRRADVRFSITTPQNSAVRAACAAIEETAWSPIRYPKAIWDEDLDQWISDAEIAETEYTAFRSTRHEVTARLVVRRVRALDPNANPGQGELFPAWRYHAMLTDSPFLLAETEPRHRGHAIIEQVNADLIDGPLRHLPSGVFTANAAWLILAAITHNLLRTAGSLASRFHHRARGATLRAHLINIPGRVARHGRGHVTVHLPTGWHAENAFTGLVNAVAGLPPARAA